MLCASNINAQFCDYCEPRRVCSMRNGERSVRVCVCIHVSESKEHNDYEHHPRCVEGSKKIEHCIEPQPRRSQQQQQQHCTRGQVVN